MDEKYISEQINFLRKELSYHNDRYYLLDQPILDDKSFDIKMKELSYLENLYPKFKDPNSPTQKIGGERMKHFSSVIHKYRMYSLDNSYSRKELINWETRIFHTVKHPLHYLCELKYDGVAISLMYRNGILKHAVTRGNGHQGDDITTNVRTISSVPLKLRGSYPNELEARGEILLSVKNFEHMNRSRIEQGKDPYSNPRNTVSGILKMQDSEEVSTIPMACCIYEIKGELLVTTQHQALNLARAWGFTVPITEQRCKNMMEVFNFIDYWERERNTFPYKTDGVVIKIDSYSYQSLLGYTKKFPRWAIAYKFGSERISTNIIDIKCQVGRTGAITPVAHLIPVVLSGTVVQRASLHNLHIMKHLNIHYGDLVVVEKIGEIIPQIVSIVIDQRDPGSPVIPSINHCPACGTILIRKKEGSILYYCPNEDSCDAQIIGKISHFVSKKAMNIDSLGEESIQLFYKYRLLKNVANLYELTHNDILPIKRIAKKLSNKIIQGIEQSKHQPFETVMYALGIPDVGEMIACTLAYHFKSIEAIQHASYEELLEVKNIGKNIATSIQRYFSKNHHLELIQKLKQYGLNFVIQENLEQTGWLTGKKFVFSGRLSKFTRLEAEKIVVDKGAQILQNISKNVDYCVIGNNAGVKLNKARCIKQIAIWNESQFIEAIKS